MTFDYLRYLWAQARQSWAKRTKSPHRVPNDVLRLIAHTLGRRDGAVLCLGARNRREPDFWRSEGYADVTAVDLLPSRGVRFADIHHLPFSDATYDLVIASHVLEHAYDSELTLKEVCRVLRPGGLLWAAWPRRFVPNKHDRVDYGTVWEFTFRIRTVLSTEILWQETSATESRALVRIG